MDITERLPATSTRVESHTAADVNRMIREQTDARLASLEGLPPERIAARIDELDREWDVERVLQTNASAIVLASLALGTTLDRRFLLLPVAVFSFFAQHALQGWCPPVPIFRRLGVRTMREIERERYALKALRGDFDGLAAPGAAPTPDRVRAALAAVDA